jgi:hypothetical protein
LNRYKLNPNPKNLDKSTIDCNVLYQKALKDAEDELVKALMDDDSNENTSKIEPTEVTCLLTVVREGNYIDQMLQYDYVKEYQLDSTKKTEMREQFVKVMTKLAGDASKCFL